MKTFIRDAILWVILVIVVAVLLFYVLIHEARGSQDPEYLKQDY
jgi:uncharacterized membrane protein